MIKCKKCGSQTVVKNGKQFNSQRYKCKKCGKVFQETKSKYSFEFKLECVKFYVRGVGIRAIAEVKKVHNSLISYWIRQFFHLVKQKVDEDLSNISVKKDIEILEVDELCTYVKKNLKMAENKRGYGLLWIGTKTKFVILK